MGGQPEEAVDDAVGGHEDAVQVGVFGDPFEFGDAADIGGIWANHVDRLLFEQILEVLAQIDLLAGVDRGRGRLGDLAVEVGEHEGGVIAGDHVLEPHDIVGFEEKSSGLDPCMGRGPPVR